METCEICGGEYAARLNHESHPADVHGTVLCRDHYWSGDKTEIYDKIRERRRAAKPRFAVGDRVWIEKGCRTEYGCGTVTEIGYCGMPDRIMVRFDKGGGSEEPLPMYVDDMAHIPPESDPRGREEKPRNETPVPSPKEQRADPYELCLDMDRIPLNRARLARAAILSAYDFAQAAITGGELKLDGVPYTEPEESLKRWAKETRSLLAEIEKLLKRIES